MITLSNQLDELGEKIQAVHKLVDAHFKAIEQLANRYNFSDPKAKK